MLKNFLHNLKYSALIKSLMKLLHNFTTNYFEKEWKLPSYEDRKIQNLYPYDDKKPWDIIITKNFLTLSGTNDHEHVILTFRVYASDRNEIKNIIKGITISAQDMSEYEGFPHKEYSSWEEYKASYEKYQQKIKVIIVP